MNCQLDLRGLFAPVSLLKVTQAFRRLSPGETLEIVASDVETRKDLFQVLDASHYELIDLQDEMRFYRVLLRKR
jgi:tRNA 2-thiouridine synthesizing protein A